MKSEHSFGLENTRNVFDTDHNSNYVRQERSFLAEIEAGDGYK